MDVSSSSSDSDDLTLFSVASAASAAAATAAAHVSTSKKRTWRFFTRQIAEPGYWCEEAGRRLNKDYFARDLDADPAFSEAEFERRFRMPRQVNEQLRDSVVRADTYFECREDAFGKRGLSTDQKITAVMRQLAYGSTSDSLVEYLRMLESTIRECLLRFCRAVVQSLKDKYLALPTGEELNRIETHYAALGFPGYWLSRLRFMGMGFMSCSVTGSLQR